MLDLERELKLYTGDLEKVRNVECELVIAILDDSEQLTKYTKAVAEIKGGKFKPYVICASHAMEFNRLESMRAKGTLASDENVSMPILLDRFTQAVQKAVIDKEPDEDDSAGNEAGGGGAPMARLGDLLIHSKAITQENLAEALKFQETSGMRLGDALIELGMITEDQKLSALAKQMRTTVAESNAYASIDINIAALIPEHIARRFNCLAIEKKDDELIVVTNDALDLRMLDILRDVTDLTITPILGKKDDILTSMERCYRDIATQSDAARIAQEMDDQIEFIKQEEDEADDSSSANELGIIKLVNVLITNAIRDRASDIHIEPQEHEVVVRYRIDGDMRRVMSPPKRSHHALVARIKILSNLNIAERRLPQDGRMVMKVGGSREVDLRVSILPTVFGEKVVMRILDKEAFDKSTANLGFSAHDERIFKTQLAKPYGIVIVTGPTGSGKSTTLYSALQTVKNVTKNIITVEDPVEFHMEGINQVHVNTKIGLTFGAALRSILRQDPDVILIGEIRDHETADIAIKMALTGHLVFSTLHTNDAASAIVRFTDIGIPSLLLSSSLNLIIAQRLVRRICVSCKVEYEPDAELLETLGLDAAKVKHLYKGTGCVSCNGTGFSGRVALFEMLEVSKDIRKLILKNASTMEIQDQAIKEGMKTIRKAGIETALEGVTTIEQVIAVSMEI
jgi:type IV pilus assembly protein PilB